MIINVPTKIITLISFLILILVMSSTSVDAHLFGGVTKDAGKYTVTFQSFPVYPSPGENSTLAFSILNEEGLNLVNISSKIQIFEDNGRTLTTIEKIYEHSDIYEMYAFPNNGIYKVLIKVEIPSESTSIDVDFEVIVGDINKSSNVRTMRNSTGIDSINTIILTFIVIGSIIIVAIILARKTKLFT